MWTDLLVFGVSTVLAGILVTNLSVIQTICQRILTWVDLPNEDAVAPWRIRFVLLVLAYPLIVTINTSIPTVREVVELVLGRDLSDFGREIFTYLKIVGVSVQIGALLCLKWLWQKIGLTISFGV
jgi:hypothetical protein